MNDAYVVCRQLGLSIAGIIGYYNLLIYQESIILYSLHEHVGAVSTTTASFGPGSGSIFLNNVQCVGSEARLVDCRRGTLTERDCTQRLNAAGVGCLQKTG